MSNENMSEDIIDFEDFHTPRSTISRHSSEMMEISRFSERIDPLPKLTGHMSDGDLRVPSVKIKKVNVRKSGVLEVRTNVLWKSRLVVLEEDMLVVYPIPKDINSPVPDCDALFEFYLGYPHESLDLVKSITVTFNDARGFQTVKLSTSPTTRVFKVTSSDSSLSLRAKDTRVKKEWFDLISSVRIKSRPRKNESLFDVVEEDQDSILIDESVRVREEIVLGTKTWRERDATLTSRAMHVSSNAINIHDIVMIRESRLQNHAFSIHVVRSKRLSSSSSSSSEDKTTRVMTFAATSNLNRSRWIVTIRQLLVASKKRMGIAKEYSKIAEAVPISRDEEEEKEDEKVHQHQQQSQNIIPMWNYRYLTTPKPHVIQRQVFLSVNDLATPSIKRGIFGMGSAVDTHDGAAVVLDKNESLWAYISVDVDNSNDVFEHLVCTERRIVKLKRDCTKMNFMFNVALLLEANEKDGELRLKLHLAFDSSESKPAISSFVVYAETRCLVCDIKNASIVTLPLIVPKVSVGSSKLEASEGGTLNMRVTPLHSNRCGLMTKSYIGLVQQKYRCAPLIQGVDNVETEHEEVRLNEDKLWTVTETLHETTLALHVPSMFLRARASELKRRQRRLHLWAQALTRALGHFTHSSSSRQADADARAAGWSIVHLEIVQGRGMRMHFDVSNSFVRASFEPHENTRRSKFPIGDTNVEFGTATPEWGTNQFPIPPLFKGCMQTECKSTSAHSRIDTCGTSKKIRSAWVFYAPPNLDGAKSEKAKRKRKKRLRDRARLLNIAISMAIDIGGPWRLLPGKRRYVARNDAVDWLLEEKHAESREDAVQLGHEMVTLGLLHCVERSGVFYGEVSKRSLFEDLLSEEKEIDDECGGVFLFGDLVTSTTFGDNKFDAFDLDKHDVAASYTSSPLIGASVGVAQQKRQSVKKLQKLTGEVLLHSNRGSPTKKKAFRLDSNRNTEEEEELPLGYINLDVFDVLPLRAGAPEIEERKTEHCHIGKLRIPVIPGRRLEGWFALQDDGTGSKGEKSRFMNAYAGEIFVRVVVEPRKPHRCREDNSPKKKNLPDVSIGNSTTTRGRPRRGSMEHRRQLRILCDNALRMIDTHCVDYESDTLAGEKLLERELTNATIGAADAAARAVEYLKRAKEYEIKSKSFETTSLIGGFKKSTDKSKEGLAYLPINLHVHALQVSSTSNEKKSKEENHTDTHKEVKWKNLMLEIPREESSSLGCQSSTVVTAGCAAAHTLGFKKGGIRRLQRAANILASDKENPKSPTVFSIHQTQSVLPEKNILQIEHRVDIVVSQALSCAVASICAEIETLLHNGAKGQLILEQIADLGYLCHFESLLTAQKNELGMLEDFEPGVRALKIFSVQFVCKGPPITVMPCGSRYVVSVCVSESLFKRFPRSLQTCLVPFVPIMFQQGINEMARLADAIGSKGGKDEVRINRESLRDLLHYVQRVEKWHETSLLPASPVRIIFERMCHKGNIKTNSLSLHFLSTLQTNCNRTQVRSAIYGSNVKESSEIQDRLSQIKVLQKKMMDAILVEKHNTRNVEILHTAAPLVRALGGGRVTSCKSGKDRTAMSVTLELASVAFADMSFSRIFSRCSPKRQRRRNSSFASSSSSTKDTNEEPYSRELLDFANFLRVHGVRLPNCWKNTGKPRFAFNVLQRQMLPEMYRPPGDVCVTIFRKLQS